MNNFKEVNGQNKVSKLLQIYHTDEFTISNTKNCLNGSAEFDFSHLAIEAAKKGKLDLMVYLIQVYEINNLKLQISKILKLLQGTVKQNHSRDSYDLPEAASYLGIGKSTMRKALSDKEIIGDRVGRKWRFTKSQLDKYIKRGKSEAEIDSEVEKAILCSKRKHK
jgi:excisionase family DNA binding protein